MLTCPVFYSLHTSLGCDPALRLRVAREPAGTKKASSPDDKIRPSRTTRSGGLAPSACPNIEPRSSKGGSAQDAEEQVGIGAI